MARGDSFELMGLNGGIVLTTGDSIAVDAGKRFRWLQIVEDAVLDVFGASVTRGSRLEDSGKLCTPTVLPAGLGIGGEFEAITVTSGTVICYYM